MQDQAHPQYINRFTEKASRSFEFLSHIGAQKVPVCWDGRPYRQLL